MPKILITTLCAILSAATSFAYDFIYHNLCYNILSEENRTVSVTCRDNGSFNENYVSGDISIPTKVLYGSKTYTVTAIDDYAFWYCVNLNSIFIPNSVISIGESAFSYCTNLNSLDIPNSVISIEDYAFSCCYGLKTFTIPSSVTSISKSAFESCSNLTSIIVEPKNTNYSSIDGILYNKNASILILCPIAKQSVAIPYSVTHIEDWAFAGCKVITTLFIPNSVTRIGESAFAGCCGLQSLTISNSLTTISYQAFYGCSNLSSLTIPNSITNIGKYAFADCSSLSSLIIPTSVQTIEDGAFSNCTGLVSLTISNSVYSIGAWAFSGCSGLTSVYIPASLSDIKSNAFDKCYLESIDVDALNMNYSSMNGMLFNKDFSTLIICPETKKTILIPNTVTAIESYAIQSCEAISEIYCIPTFPPDATNNCFSDEALINATLYVPKKSKSKYETTDPWRNFFNIVGSDFSSVTTVTTDNSSQVQLSVERGILTISGLNTGTHITIHDVQGRMVYSGTSHTISHLASGLYILRTPSLTTKFSL